MSSRARTVARAGAVALLVALLPAAPASAVGSPSLTITAPAARPVSGPVTVSVDGTTDGAGTAGAVEVYADTGSGPQPIGSVVCPGTGTAPSGCTGGLVWDSTTAVNGPVSLSASLFDNSASQVLVVSTLASTAHAQAHADAHADADAERDEPDRLDRLTGRGVDAQAGAPARSSSSTAPTNWAL